MYLPRDPNAQPVKTNAPGAPALPLQLDAQQTPARRPARRLTRNPVLVGIVNNAMRMWK